MKIAFMNLYSGINNRGAESFMHDLATQLAKSNQVDFYYGGKGEGKEEYQVKASNLSQVNQPQHSKQSLLKRLFLDAPARQVFQFTWSLFSQLRSEKYDVLIPVNGFWQLLICKLVAIFTGSRILVVGNSGPFWDERFNLYLKPDVFVATTGPVGEWAKKVCPWTRVEVIPYAIDIALFAEAKAKKFNLEKPIILCPAAAVSYKQVDRAIKAVALMEKGSLLHVGDGPLKDELMALGEKELGSKRFLSTAFSYWLMPSVYAGADLVTLPSQSQENSPMVFQEAIASGKRTVVSDSSRFRWLLGETGVYTTVTDPNEYAKSLQEGLKAIDSKVFKKEQQRYSWSTVLGQYEGLLKNL